MVKEFITEIMYDAVGQRNTLEALGVVLTPLGYIEKFMGYTVSPRKKSEKKGG